MIVGSSLVRTDATELVEKYYELVDEIDDAMFDLFHVDIVYKRPGYRPIVGLQALRLFYTRDRLILSGRHLLQRIFADGSYVAVEGEFVGVLKDGSRADLAFSDFFDLDNTDGNPRIISRRTYFDDDLV